MKEENDVTVKIGTFVPKHSNLNKVSTCKYTWWNFIFLFLFEQYQKACNIFYLLNAICAFIPGAAVVSPATLFMPIIFVLLVAAIREILEDIGRANADKAANTQRYISITSGESREISSAELAQGDIVILKKGQEVPADALLLCSSDPSGKAFVNTASLDGESNLKPKSQMNYNKVVSLSEAIALYKPYKADVIVPPPNNHMNQFNGALVEGAQRNSFMFHNIMLRGMRLQNTEFAVLALIYTGFQTRVLQNNKAAKGKISRLDGRLNRLIFIMIGIALMIMTIFAILGSARYSEYSKYNLFQLEPSSASVTGIQRFVQFFVITANLLPISLFVSLELARFVQALMINSDKKLRKAPVQEWMEHNVGKPLSESPYNLLAPPQISVQVKNSVSVENLAEVSIIFSDKTGTLTKNSMAAHSYLDKAGAMYSFKDQLSSNAQCAPLFCIGLCNTVLPMDGDYQGESPDEVAFARGAAHLGFKLSQTNVGESVYEYRGGQIRYKVLAEIPFSSSRKRMSLLLQEINDGVTPEQITTPGAAFVITKGADSFMFPRMVKLPEDVEKQVKKQIDILSEKGLRTLVFASKKLSDADEWLRQWDEIRKLPEDDPKYVSHTATIESDLVYQCATAVEDELQDEIVETLSTLRAAKINLWMLTGDKTNTAESIASSSGLSATASKKLHATLDVLQEQRQQMNLPKTQEGLLQALEKLLDKYIGQQMDALAVNPDELQHYKEDLEKKIKVAAKGHLTRSPKQNLIRLPKQLVNTPTTVVLDSDVFELINLPAALTYNLRAKFFQIAFAAEAVVCCRLSPDDKATVVGFSHLFYPQLTSLSIGDGANDVRMIKAAQIGIGVAGKEGMHACNNADISIPEFKFLKRLIFVHGHMSHARNAFVADYSVFKNAAVVFCNLLYQIFCMQTAQIAVESFLVMLFNTLIAFFGIFIFSITEKDVYEKHLEVRPGLHHFRELHYPDLYSMGFSVFNAFYTGTVIFFFHYWYGRTGVHHSSGIQSDLYFMQTSITVANVMNAILRVLTQTNVFNLTVLIGVILALLSNYLTMVVGNVWTAFGIGQVGQIQFMYTSLGQNLLLMACVVVCAIPDFLVRHVRRYLHPQETERLMNADSGKGFLRELA